MEVLLAELEGPLSSAALRVYADRLLERGDLHGEFITLQCERAERGGPPSVREEQLRREVLEPRLREVAGPKLRVTRWELGLIHELTLEVDAAPITALAAIASRAESQGLTRLELDGQAWNGGGDLTSFWASLPHTARFPRLEELSVRVGPTLDDPRVEGPIAIGDVEPLYAAYPSLRVLELHGVAHHLGQVVLPELRRFAASELRPECIPSLVGAYWPCLETLELEFGPAPAESEPVFAALLSAPMSAALTRVKVKSPWPEFFRAALPRSPLGKGRVIET